MTKTIETAYPVHDLVAARWSPVAFRDEPVTEDALHSLFEAVRWAPSCYNDQPWNFVYARRDMPEAFETILSTLVPLNQEWACHAPVLAISVARKMFRHNNQPNAYTWHDIGLATGIMAVQAASLGLSVHVMAGFDPGAAQMLLHIPEGYEPVTAMAIGYAGDPANLSERLQARDNAPRTRVSQDGFVHRGKWSEDS